MGDEESVVFRSGGTDGIKMTEQEVITEAFVRRIGAFAMLQSDGSIKIGWNDPHFPPPEPIKNVFVHIKFKDGNFDIIELRKS